MKPVAGFEVELALFGQAVLSGVCLVAVYDILRIIRRIIPHGIIWVSVEDLVYWCFAGAWLFLKVCQVNNGIVRGYMILGMLAGIALYYQFCSRIFMKYLTKWIIYIKKRLKRVSKAVTIRLENVHRNRKTGTKNES